MRISLIFSFVFLGFFTSSQAQIITLFAGNGTAGYSGDGSAAVAAAFNRPEGIAVDDSGNVYIADAGNNRVRKVNTSGVVTTIAGTGIAGFSGDSGPALNAQLNNPTGVAVDRAMNIYIADYNNARVRVINTSGSITTVAGNGTVGFTGDGGTATTASISKPYDVTTDAAGNLYIADQANQRIRKVSSGIISTYAGNGTVGYSGDLGPATNASLNTPAGLSVDSNGNLYIADKLNNVVRRVSSAGVISTFAGNGLAGYGGDHGIAGNSMISAPTGLATDTLGNVYIADKANHRVRVVNANDTVTTFAGNGTLVYGGNGGAATNAGVVLPAHIAVDHMGNMYISDSADNVIRRVSPFVNHAPHFTLSSPQSATVCVNSGANPVNILLSVNDTDAGQSETWTLTSGPAHGAVIVGYAATSTGGVIVPSGITYTPSAGYSGADSFIINVSDGFANDLIKILVNVNTTLTLTSAFTATACSGSPVNYLATSNVPGAAITWMRAAVSGITPATGSGGNYIGETLINATTSAIPVNYVFNITSSACSITQNVMVTVQPTGTTHPVIGTIPPSWLCSNTMYRNFGASAPADSGVVYNWSAKNATVWATGSNRQYCLVNFPDPGVAYVYLTAALPGYTCGSKDSFAVAVSSGVAETPDVSYFNGLFFTTEGMYTYQWGYDDAATLQPTVIAGATSSFYANSTPDFANKHYWVITEHLLCQQKSYYNVPAGVQNINEGGITEVTTYPNPTNGAFNVKITAPLTEEGIMKIVNISGVTVMEMPCITNNEIRLNIDQPEGLYFIHIKTSHGNYTGKLSIVNN